MDLTAGSGYADDPNGPLCGSPTVGFGNTRLTGDGSHEPDFENHWSMTDTSDPEENFLHRWFTGTDDAQGYGFFAVDPDFADLSQGQLAYLACRWPALAGSNEVVDVRLRGRTWEVVDGTSAAYDINYGNQSDGWFYFQVHVHDENQPASGCSQCSCSGTPVACSCSGQATYQLLFQLSLGADEAPYTNNYFDDGNYDWAVTKPTYRVVWNEWEIQTWTRANLVYTSSENDYRTPRAIFSVDVPGWCSMTNYVTEQNPCRIEVAQMQPYTIHRRDAFVAAVEDFCDTSPYCEVYRSSTDPPNPPPGIDAADFGYGGLAAVNPAAGEGYAEENALVAIEFHPANMVVPPQNIIYVLAGDDYEPNGMFVAEGLINELMASPAALLEGMEYERVSFAILFGTNPDNLSWGTTHVRPRGDGEGRLWQGGMWGLESIEWLEEGDPPEPVVHENADPEAVALRAYYGRLADPADEDDALGDQVAVLVSLHGDITPHAPTRWGDACSNPGGDYFFAPVYGIWHYDGMNPANQSDPAAFTGSGALGYVQDRMGTLADYLRDPQVAGHSVWSRYIRPLSEWYPHENVAWHNFHLTSNPQVSAEFSTYPYIEPPISVTFEFDEMGLYLNEEDLAQNENCEKVIVPCPNSPYFRYCMQGYIDDMAVYHAWGKTLAWALRETFHDLPGLPIQP